MDAAKRDLARRLFEEAIRSGRPDAAEWTSTRSSDKEVIEEVRRLLVQHGSHPTHSDALVTPTAARLADSLLGATLGGFTIEKLVGVGGMGRVYVAASSGQPKREVALKVLAHGLTGSIALQRFQREAELLQRMHHPGIAQFFGSGTYDDGEGAVPWFAMEFIGGAVSLAQWCETKRLDTRGRIALVAQASDAIGYAHQLGIVHRDLKPANILVDAKGEPKIIDFGVARCVGADSGLVALQTQTGQLVGTMQYMSPEQFEADPRRIDARSDVYALGVILFELLSGTFPHDVRTLPVAEAARMVCHDAPPDIRTVLQECDGMLAAIVAQCLARNRESRYADASQVGAALSSWLRGEHALAIDDEALESGTDPRQRPGSKRPARIETHRALEEQAIRRSGGWLVPIFSLVLVTTVGLVAFGVLTPQRVIAWWKRTAEETSASGGDVAATVAPHAPAFEEVIAVTSEPPGASVTVDGAPLGTTPCRGTVVWRADSTSATVVVSKSGFKRETVVVAAAPRGGRTAALSVAVRLVPASDPTPP
jgi:serine/threonine protein kinase